jgi:hypothetical protein
MKVVCQTLWLPKRGNSEEEYEDAAAPAEPLSEDTDEFRCAVADGATETSFSRLWAQLLVDGFVANTDCEELKAKWHESIADKPLPWYAEQKAESGAYAALVGLTIKQVKRSGGTWKAEAIGDSCLIHVRGSDVLERFPLKHSDEFNSTPALLSSNEDDGLEHDEEFTFIEGEWRKGDIFYLLSDAIARWVYKRQEDYSDAAFWLKSMKSQNDLKEFVDVQRELMDAESRPLMRNDDVTLMRVTLE